MVIHADARPTKDCMDPTAEMDISDESENDENDAFIQHLDAMRKDWLAEVDLVSSSLKTELQTLGLDYETSMEHFRRDAIQNVQLITEKATEQMKEVRRAAMAVSLTPDEKSEEQEIRDILQKLDEHQTRRQLEKDRLLDRRADGGEQLAKRLQDLQEKLAVKELDVAKHKAKATAGCQALGIRLDHTPEKTGFIQVHFVKLANLPAVEPFIVLNCQPKDGPILVRHWPQHPEVEALGRQLAEDGTEGITRFLIAARTVFREHCRRTSQELSANSS